MNLYYGVIAPWEQYPKNLRYDEARFPLTVVSEFFSWDWPDHLTAQLKTWLHFVVTPGVYHDGAYEPGDLLFFYDQHLKLLEALYLLQLDDKDDRHRDSETIAAKRQRLEWEKKHWRWFPANLTEQEQLEPYKVLEELFDRISPQTFRDHLHKWLYVALSKEAVDETLTPGEIITVYETIKKVHAAAWLIYQRETPKPHLNDAAVSETKQVTETGNDDNPNSHRPPQVDKANATETERTVFNEIIQVLTARMPAIKGIWLIGKTDAPVTYFLLILINDNEKLLEHELTNKIEDNCRNLAKVFPMVHKVKSAAEGISGGRRFWNNILHQSENLYSAGDLQLPATTLIDNTVWLERAKKDWERWGTQGKAFFNGGIAYLESGQLALAVFSFHQAAESSLIAIIKAVLGYRPSAHNLARMVRITQLFTEDIKAAFKLDTEEGVRLFNLLQAGYSQARYKSDFAPDTQSVSALKDIVERVLLTTKEFYEQYKNKSYHNLT